MSVAGVRVVEFGPYYNGMLHRSAVSCNVDLTCLFLVILVIAAPKSKTI